MKRALLVVATAFTLTACTEPVAPPVEQPTPTRPAPTRPSPTPTVTTEPDPPEPTATHGPSSTQTTN